MSASRQQRNAASTLNISFIQDKMDQAIGHTNSTSGRDLILVLGCTGVGKSTLCNYLVGHPMKGGVHGGLPVVETAQDTDIKIGHTVEAATLYAQGFTAADPCSPGRDVCLVDCPGFLGNRSVEECVVEFISTELCVRSGRRVKGFLITLSYPGIMESRMHEFLGLVRTLMALFKDPLEMVGHSVFVINKHFAESAEAGLDASLARMQQLKRFAEDQAQTLMQQAGRNLHPAAGLSVGDYGRIAGFFAAVLADPARVVMVDPLDQGQSRARIFQQLDRVSELGVRPITVEDFNFADFGEHRVTFNRAVYFRVREGASLMQRIRDGAERSTSIGAEVSSLEGRISQLRELRANLKDEMAKVQEGQAQQDCKSAKTLEVVLQDVEASRQTKLADSEAARQRRGQLEAELNALDVDDERLFQRDSVTLSNRPWWVILLSIILELEPMRDFTFDTRDDSVPIVNVKKDKDGQGEWRNERDSRRSGSYSVQYFASPLAESGWAWVEAYIRNRDDAGVRVRMQQVREEIRSLEERLSRRSSELEELDEKAEAMRASIQQSQDDEEGYRTSLQQKLSDCDRDASGCEDEIRALQAENKQIRRLQVKLLEEFQDEQPKFEAIVTIGRLLTFPSTLVTRFIADYGEFYSRLDEYYKCILPPDLFEARSNEQTRAQGSSARHSQGFTPEEVMMRCNGLDRVQSSSSTQSLVLPDLLDEVGVARLREQREALTLEIQRLKEEIDAKETDLERIIQVLEKNEGPLP